MKEQCVGTGTLAKVDGYDIAIEGLYIEGEWYINIVFDDPIKVSDRGRLLTAIEKAANKITSPAAD